MIAFRFSILHLFVCFGKHWQELKSMKEKILLILNNEGGALGETKCNLNKRKLLKI